MATFTYTALSGSPATGTVEASDRASAVRELVRRGITPAAVQATGETGRSGARNFGEAGAGGAGVGTGLGLGWRRSAMGRAEFASFIRELATALSAGLPLVLALRTIAKQGRSAGQRAMLARIIEEVEHGKSLAEAAGAWGKPFNELTVNLIRAGEASGRLETVLLQAAELLDRDVKLRRSLLSATLYPLILTAVLALAIVVVVTFIVPRVLGAVGGVADGSTLPLPTRIVKGTAEVIGGYWWAWLLGIGGVAWGARRVYASPGTGLAIDARVARAPLVGRLVRDVAVARFTRTLGTLTSAGVPILQALRITKGTLGNRAMEAVIDRVGEQVAGGKTIAEPMEASGFFPPMLVQIVNLGERSGKLDEMLSRAAGVFEDRTEQSVKLFTAALPPILVVMLACVVGFVVLAILLPVLQMQEMMR